MKYYAVIDTNVIVSSLLKHDSIPGIIFDLIAARVIVPLINEEIIDEYIDVLTRNKFGFSDVDVNNYMETIRSNSIQIDSEKTNELFTDKDDIVFYEVVLSARNTMDAYLVTGNLKHYPIKSYVVTPREMLDIINNKK